MMGLDSLNILDTWPLLGLSEFKDVLDEHGIREINLTGTNTDPLLYRHIAELREFFRDYILGVRTNAALALSVPEWRLFDKGSITICSLDPVIYKKMMGQGNPPDVPAIIRETPWRERLKVNIVLGPENAKGDVLQTLIRLSAFGIKRVNLREPYGQPHVGNPLAHCKPTEVRLGMPVYYYLGMEVCYWDVHYCEVESVNLYANGRVSLTYPITKGYVSDNGRVFPQATFPGGRIQEQWISSRKKMQSAQST